MNPRKGYRENVAEQERRMIELEHKLEVVTRQRDELEEALAAVHAELECPCRNLQLGLPHGDVVAISSGVRAKVKQALATKEGGV